MLDPTSLSGGLPQVIRTAPVSPQGALNQLQVPGGSHVTGRVRATETLMFIPHLFIAHTSWHGDLSSATRERSPAPCSGSAVVTLDHQGSPIYSFFFQVKDVIVVCGNSLGKILRNFKIINLCDNEEKQYLLNSELFCVCVCVCVARILRLTFRQMLLT